MATFNFFTNGAIISGQGKATSELKSSLFSREEIEEESFDKRSIFGTPVYSNLEIPAGEYTDLEGRVVRFEGIRIDAVLFDLSQERNIVRTQISGRNGTIKQFVSDGDIVISCQGIITGKSTEENKGFSMNSIVGVPEEEIRKLSAICSVPREIEVVSEFLDFFDITTVVISAPSFAQKEGNRGEILFSLQMYSDQPVELK
ncbi:structural protein [Flavobacterium phage vB_FspM_lotta8-1]|uniref:Structural protein n=3 Tax=Pippivirus TaxID=2843435 RepID=A0A6B9LLB1_9CAUD|nr:structural protein [Flavobacterium phage vB_FspM_lotta8-1]YP_009854572.1 structural protein [Flavobacterium phage vB_FspM_pippi8-1]QHB38499.1 structural protein [Flavobacterium phage vB_FspM_lotta8-1]QHB38552.1 structural protein [Flavobacterium phage vB_FspM_lotta8-2]QHB38605.1 structural protein [Flavobacterium phage vB_FspM_pippi8-1]